MECFNVLSKEQPIHANYLIEASAGTGKTFSIENIVVRLLFEEPSLSIEEILVVTFTRAATRDLKTRIRANIERCVEYLEIPGCQDGPEYLQNIVEAQTAKKKLEKALLYFDQAQIFTIHSFCARILNENVFEGHLPIDAISVEDPLTQTFVISIIRDFFRTRITPENYGTVELEKVLKEYQGDLSRLEKALLDVLSKGANIKTYPPFSIVVQQFDKKMRQLKESLFLESGNIIEDFIRQAPSYNKLCDKKREVKSEVMDRVERFAELLERDSWDAEAYSLFVEDNLFLVSALDPANLSTRRQPPSSEELHYPNLRSILKEHLGPLINPTGVFARMAHDCLSMYRDYLQQEEKFGFDDILKAMREAIKNPLFAKKVQSKFKAAIVDEFQDTDPIQWEIFSKLFSPQNSTWDGFLYLVGDPKQSIYSFRQADIYTYFAAAKEIGEGNLASLTINYRSQPQLIHALNVLFSEERSPGWMAMPGLSCPEVGAPKTAPERLFKDNRGSVHFYITEDNSSARLSIEAMEREQLFPFMVQEIQRLKKMDGVRYDQFAILVADRFQAKRTADFLKDYHIPSMLQRSGSLAELPAFAAWIELLQGVLHPKHESSLKTALGGKILRWTHEQVRQLDNPKILQKVLIPMVELRKVLQKEGVIAFFQKLLNTCWDDDGLTVLERLLLQDGGETFFDEFQQVAELLFEYEVLRRPTPEGFIGYLVQLKSSVQDEDPRVKKLLDPTQQAVNIMTLHASKGLEFDIVFTLGLIKRSRAPAQLVPLRSTSELTLVAVSDTNNPEYRQYCEEIDAEKMRQLYVAMTRARYRLYNPVVLVPRVKPAELGCASPMELFWGRIGGKNFDFSADEGITKTWLQETPSILSSEEDYDDVILHPPLEVVIPGFPRFIHSFSSLNSKHAQSRRTPPHDFSAIEKTQHTLPSGAETDILLHRLFEKIPFTASSPSELVDAIAPFTIGTPYYEWAEVLATIYHLAMVTPLTDSFCLAEVDPTCCFAEAEFLYSSSDNSVPGYVKGFIDLTFQHDGKYYLIDWKSNWLGETCCDYNQGALKSSMEENNYFFQAQLYEDALKKFLSVVDPRPFEEIFGGTFYLFLRGLHVVSDQTYGVFKL